MSSSRRLAVALALVTLAPGLASVLRAQQPPILESYSLQLGTTDAAGVTAHLVDDFFGHGSARARLLYVAPMTIDDPTATGTLALRVWRRVPRGQITFALLVDGVEVRGFSAGGLVGIWYLPSFAFGDSASGNWNRTIDDVPANVLRIEVTFFGNYE